MSVAGLLSLCALFFNFLLQRRLLHQRIGTAFRRRLSDDLKYFFADDPEMFPDSFENTTISTLLTFDFFSTVLSS